MGEKVFQDLDRAGWRVGGSDAGCLNTPNTVVQTGEQRARLFEYGLISRGLVEPCESRARPVCAAVRGKPRRGRVMHPASEPPHLPTVFRNQRPCQEPDASKNTGLAKAARYPAGNKPRSGRQFHGKVCEAVDVGFQEVACACIGDLVVCIDHVGFECDVSFATQNG